MPSDLRVRRKPILAYQQGMEFRHDAGICTMGRVDEQGSEARIRAVLQAAIESSSQSGEIGIGTVDMQGQSGTVEHHAGPKQRSFSNVKARVRWLRAFFCVASI